ncbi:MAG TPA: AMP-binding protein, partial [Candidatus Baltobacteraceae bacterium]|nr:AMP-binding protein [Candidatus Baltobacteraceae bacterium]
SIGPATSRWPSNWSMLLDLLDGALADRADARAIDDLSYRQLDTSVRRVARRFFELGVRRGDRVAIYCENRHGFVFAYLAALRLGAIAVPINVLYRSSDLRDVLDDARPSSIVCSTASSLSHAATGNARVVEAVEVEAWANAGDAAALEGLPPAPDDIAAIVYTSGTTGRSKGAMLSHRNLAAISAQLIAAWRWQAQDVLLLALPLFHVHGLIAGLTTSLAAGGRVILRPRFDANDVLDRLAEGGVTMFFGVPTMYVRLLEQAPLRPPKPMRLFVSGSAPLSARTHDAFRERFGASILERYGATEFGFALSNRYGGPRVAGSVGVALPGVRVRIADPSGQTQALPADTVGELLVAGPNVFEGYWQRPDATAAAFSTDEGGTRWYRSGDLAQYDSQAGVYRIVGRIKELIITGGFNVYPREVEAAVERFDGVRACAVVGKPDPARGELPIAFVEGAADVDAEALLAALREQLASFKVPREVRILDELPRNAMGKLDKPALRKLLET